MARGEKIALNDVMPRHLRGAGEVPSTVTISVGATISDARKQLVLRTFASHGGDTARTAKVLGVDHDEVRRDLLALLNGTVESTVPITSVVDADESIDRGGGVSAPRQNGPGPVKKQPTKKR
jgi:hypothetical protein